MTWTAEIPNWPYRNQLATGETDDGKPAENYALDCGETCIAMPVEDLTGVVLQPDTVKDAILGQGATGGTNELQLAAYLRTRCATPTTIYRPTDRGTAMALIRQYVRNNQPLIVLRYASYVGDIAGHWNCIIGGDGPDDTHTANVITADPWGGFRRLETRDTFWSWCYDYSAGGGRLFIGIDRTRDLNLP